MYTLAAYNLDAKKKTIIYYIMYMVAVGCVQRWMTEGSVRGGDYKGPHSPVHERIYLEYVYIPFILAKILLYVYIYNITFCVRY